MKFDKQFIDDLKSRLPVSAVVGRRLELKKAGREYKAFSPFNTERTPSFFVNDEKQSWFDFSSNRNGDIFDFLVAVEGMTLEEAIEQCAAEAGVSMPDGKKVQPKPPKKIEPPPANSEAGKKLSNKRKEAAVYDYENESGYLLYQVVRFHFVRDDGEVETDQNGKPRKTIAQRRPFREEEGRWIWGLSDGEFMRRGPGYNWSKYSAREFKDWNFTERRTFKDAPPHGLYKLPELKAAIADERVVFIPEGEKKVDTLTEWGMAATTNSGGAAHFTEALAVHFVGADAVILVDNDEPGRKRGHDVAMLLRKAGAKRIRIVDLAQHWSECPHKGDVTDWAEAGGSAETLWEIVEKTVDWKPEPPKSAFGAVRYIDLDLPSREHEWLVKNLLPRQAVAMTIGQWQSGKSFFALDLAFTIARAAVDPSVTYLGRRVRGGLSLYQAGEAGLGMKMRLRAARDYYQTDPLANVPFLIMPVPLNMYSSDDPVNAFIAEAKQWSAYYEMPIELITIDTFAAATAGANENSSEHVSLILDRGNRISRDLQCTVNWVHHLNAAGEKARGHSSLMGNVDTVIEIKETDRIETERIGNQTVDRTVREAKVIKQKEQARGFHWDFVLKAVEIGRDEDNEPVTSCIITATGESAPPPSEPTSKRKGVGIFLTKTRLIFFRSLLRAIDEAGEVPPTVLGLPTQIEKVVDWRKVRYAYRTAVLPNEEDAKKHQDGVKKALQRLQEFFVSKGICGVDNSGEVPYIWLTGKPVFSDGFQWPPQKEKPPVEDDGPLRDPLTGEEMVL